MGIKLFAILDKVYARYIQEIYLIHSNLNFGYNRKTIQIIFKVILLSFLGKLSIESYLIHVLCHKRL